MQDCGADLLKLAAMPRDAGDVLTLLSATWEMKEQYAKQPVVTMSMGAKGAVSRLAGEVFGCYDLRKCRRSFRAGAGERAGA